MRCLGIAQLMNTPCHLLGYRVSLHVGRKIEYILKMRSLPQKNLDWFVKAVRECVIFCCLGHLIFQHLSGPDNGSLRAEIIRYVWNNIQQPEYQQPSAIEVRAQFLAWLLKGARVSYCRSLKLIYLMFFTTIFKSLLIYLKKL